jgi:RNA polymerase sigma factor (sigma-70 family)
MVVATFPFTTGICELSDELLVELVEESHLAPAEQVLLERYVPLVHRLAKNVVRHFRGLRRDWDDVLQVAYLAFVEAIRRYDLQQHSRARVCGFRTFLRLVVSRRVYNYLRAFMRWQRHLDPRIDLELFLTEDSDQALAAVAGKNLDPAWLAEQAESLGRLARAIEALPQRLQRLCEATLEGRRATEIAREFGVSPRTVQRWSQQTFVRLQRMLQEGDE